MFREIFQSTPAALYSSIALVLFLAAFAAVTVWVGTRKRKTIDTWANLALDEGTTPAEPRTPLEQKKPGCCGKCTCGRKAAKEAAGH